MPVNAVVGSINSSWDILGLHYQKQKEMTKEVKLLKSPKNKFSR